MDDDDDTRKNRKDDSGSAKAGRGDKPGRGRPPKGKPTLVRLDLAEQDFAMQLGAGVVAEGVRRALAIVSLLRPEQIESMMNKPARFPLHSSHTDEATPSSNAPGGEANASEKGSPGRVGR